MDKKSLDQETKKQEIYIEQISGHVDEKIELLLKELKHGNLPLIDDKIRVLDCGIGGGESLVAIKSEIKNPNLDIIAFDLIIEYVQRFTHMNQGSHGVVGDAFKFPFKDNSLSAINVSAVLHEVISYGFNESNQPERLSIVNEFISSVVSSLAKGGIITYRDIFLPENHQETQSIEYSSHFKDFLSVYFTLLSKRASIIYKTQIPEIVYNKETCKVSGALHYHREFQRHFVTFMDFMSRGYGYKSLEDFLSSGENLDKIFNLSENTSEQERLMYTWQKREGSEVYTYASLEEIKSIVTKVREELKIGLQIETEDTTERIVYSKILSSLCSSFIPDKKQRLLIRKFDN